MNELRIRPYEAADAASLTAFGSAHGLPVGDGLASGGGWRGTLVAETRNAVADGTVVVGAGTLRRSTHSAVYGLEIDMTDAAGEGGLVHIGPRLYDELRRLRPEPLPVLWRAMASRPERMAFAQAAGFEVLMLCPSPIVDPTSAETRRWISEHESIQGVLLTTAEECPATALADAWVSYYEWVHASWVPVTSISAVRKGFLNGMLNGVDLSLSTLAVRDGRIAAFALVLPNAWDNRHFVCSETVRREEPDGRALVGAVIAASLRRLSESGYTAVEFEGHTIDPHFGPLASSLPTVGADPLTILRAD